MPPAPRFRSQDTGSNARLAAVLPRGVFPLHSTPHHTPQGQCSPQLSQRADEPRWEVGTGIVPLSRGPVQGRRYHGWS
jgi:hypothetical protein